MGLKDKLTQQGSPLSRNNGGQNTIPVGATDQSKLHFEYSINGNPEILGRPEPSQLDLNGITPLAPNRDGLEAPINNTFAKGTYKNSAPTEGIGRI